MKKFVIIDGNALIHRGFYAIPEMRTKSGEVVNGVYGFASMLVNILEKEKPDFITVAFDVKGPTIRHEQFKEYKATRVKAPDELYIQIPKIKELCKAFNIPTFGIKGYEADDIIGTMSKNLKTDPELMVEIVTGDLDVLQLIDKNVNVLTPHKGFSETKTYDDEAVKERYGLDVDQLVDYKALRGDPSDNIPGVRGIGEKTAVKLLQEYKTLDGIYENIENIQGKPQTLLKEGKDSAYQSQQLAQIITDIKLDGFNIDDCKTHEFQSRDVREVLEDLDFNSIIRRLERAGILKNKAEEQESQQSLF